MAADNSIKHTLDKNIKIGINSSGVRQEFDSMGEVSVPADRYWGAQTQRSLQHFNIGNDLMPKDIYHAYGYIKKACALVNFEAGRLVDWKKDAIIQAADETISGNLDDHYPLYVWQTGSGTQSNMNVNEVISNRAIQLLGGSLGTQDPIGPNDDVNMGQSSNDTFPTAMHIAVIFSLDEKLIPSIQQLIDIIESKAASWMNVVKIGRTHLEDAVPLTVGQEWYGWAGQLRDSLDDIKRSKTDLYKLAVGGTAVGTGLNAPKGFSKDVAAKIAELTQKPFITAPNKFTAQGSLDALVRAHSAIKGLAVSLIKIANDMRWLASGPRCGLSELILPSNEPGSSIMPGKVNPTQCEAVVMIGIQVMGNDTAISISGSQGNFELNAMRPVIINNLLHSILILADGCQKFREFSVEGTTLNNEKIKEYVDDSVMLVTALSPIIGYQNSAHIAENAIQKNITLKESAISSGKISEEDFDKYVNAIAMTGNGLSGA
ncbi:fumarate hydratase [Yersinia rohdei]|uniref:class II fumarate hydratase n=1 Tax=Yersinia rohdei TaxID=29485 RepID=UPI00061BB721|nr:class II fumarate hydratase [Yersinia rohdei]CNE34645.1 fumarate hydratase [Yersinia rohdei]